MFYVSILAASVVKYSILEGNIDSAFLIESLTGKIRVNSTLDYENITSVSHIKFIEQKISYGI